MRGIWEYIRIMGICPSVYNMWPLKRSCGIWALVFLTFADTGFFEDVEFEWLGARVLRSAV